MYNLCGQYSIKPDNKSRITIPSDLRKNLIEQEGETPSLCIRSIEELFLAVLYPEKVYDAIAESLYQDPKGKRERIAFFAYTTGRKQLDSQGRIVLPKYFSKKQGVLVGNGDSMFFTTRDNLNLLVESDLPAVESPFSLELRLRKLLKETS